jgi:hypothetical protein
MALKRARHRRDFGFDSREIRNQLLANGYEELALKGQHLVAADFLPPIHKDPFDRLLIAQAMVEGITLLTADSTIARYLGPIRKAIQGQFAKSDRIGPTVSYAVVRAQSSSKARTSSPAIICAVACSMT